MATSEMSLLLEFTKNSIRISNLIHVGANIWGRAAVKHCCSLMCSIDPFWDQTVGSCNNSDINICVKAALPLRGMKNSTSAYLTSDMKTFVKDELLCCTEARERAFNTPDKQCLGIAVVEKSEKRYHPWNKLHYGSYLRLDSDSYCFTKLSMLQKALEIINT